jgi:hypothetical protein
MAKERGEERDNAAGGNEWLTMSVCRRIPAGRALEVETDHCEERSDEAIQYALAALDCFASLAMTTQQ